MQIFNLLIFAENEANGTGYLQLIDDGTDYPSWKEVKNNIATVKAGSPPELPKYAGGVVNNYAFPEGSLEVIGRPINDTWGLGILDKKWSIGQVFTSRMITNATNVATVPLRQQIIKQPIDFYLIEDNVDILLTAIIENDRTI